MTGEKQELEDSGLLHGDYLGKPGDITNVDIRTTKLRWLVLLLACMINFGNYFCFDNPQALQSYLTADLDITGTEFNLLYSVYSFPNIVLPLFGGLLIDRIGVRVAVVLFASLLILGQLIVFIGAIHKSYALMIVGRVVFGLGGESLGVSQSSITVQWFMGKELAFSMGATLCIARVGSSLNSFLSPKIYNWAGGNLSTPFLVGLILCIVSWACGFALTVIDKKAEQQGASGKATVDTITLQDIKAFKPIFFLLLFNCFFLYGAFFGLNNNLNDLMVDRFGFDPDTAGNFIPIVYLSSAVITPFFGMFTDHYGKRVLFMLISSVIFFGDHLLIAFLQDTIAPDVNYGMVGALVGVGLFYSTYAAIFWPCVPLVVKEKVIGTAYGIITALQNLMLTIIPLLIGVVHDNTESKGTGYFWTEILLAGLVLVGICITTMMYFEDIKKGGRLNRPGTKRESKAASLIRSFKA